MALSTQQKRILSNDRVHFVGWDEKDRPVVEGMFGIPHQLQRWAISRKGDPLDITGAVREVDPEDDPEIANLIREDGS